MLLLRESPEAFGRLTPDQMQEVIRKYVEWRERLAAQGKLQGGNKLRSGDGRVVRPEKGNVTVTDKPFVEAKEIVGGYFIISARDYDEAVTIAKQCPHTMFGGATEVREIEPT